MNKTRLHTTTVLSSDLEAILDDMSKSLTDRTLYVPFKPFTRDVPCGTCKACCKNQDVYLTNYDDVGSYKTELRYDLNGASAHILQHKPNGDCIYLGEEGCTIHDRLPAVCRAFDCRAVYLTDGVEGCCAKIGKELLKMYPLDKDDRLFKTEPNYGVE